MNTRNKCIKHFRPLFLLLALLVMGSAAGWGQDAKADSDFDGYQGTENAYQITNKVETDNPSANNQSYPVPVWETTIYVPEGESRELFIREILENQLSHDFYWYTCWYLDDDSKVNLYNVLSKAMEVKALSSYNFSTDNEDFKRSALRRAQITNKENRDALFWSKQIFAPDNMGGDCMYFSRESSHIMCELPTGNEGFTVICDVSYNNDYEYDGFIQLEDGKDATEVCKPLTQQFTAPTLAKRYKFHIRPAKGENLISSNNPFEKYTIYAPQTDNEDGINIQLARPLDNYYWTKDNKVTHINFEHDWNKKTPVSKETLDAKGIEIVSNPRVENITLNNSYQVFTLEFPNNIITETTTVIIRHTEDNIIFAEYTIIPVENAGFTAEVEILDKSVETQPYHEPEKHPELYEEIGVVDFDSFDGMEKVMGVIEGDEKSLKDVLPKKNALAIPLDTALTSYSFAYPSLDETKKIIPTILGGKFTPQKNMYGLYRTASKKTQTEPGMKNQLGKTYQWYYKPYIMDKWSLDKDEQEKIQIFDRTYRRYDNMKDSDEDKDKHQYGFFLYVDAAQEPGRIITVPITGQVCGGTELLVTAWINNMTSMVGTETRPNLNLHLIGTNGKDSKILHRFTTGYALSRDKDEGFKDPRYAAPHYIGRWQQLHYSIILSDEEMQNYTDFHLEIYNNAPNSDGNDFAIDDIRIYRKLVHASARQANSLCEDANTISVRLKYDELMSVLALKQGGGEVDSDLQPNNAKHDNLLSKLQNVEGYKDSNLSKYRKVQYYIFGVDNKWKENLQEWANENDVTVGVDIIGDDQELVEGKGDDEALYLNMKLVRKIQALADEVKEPLTQENQPLRNCFRYAQLYYYNDEDYETKSSYHGFSVISADKDLMNQGSTDNVLAACDGENVIFQNIRLPANTPSRRYYLIYIPSESATQEGNLASFDDDCGIYAPFRLKKAADLVTVVDNGTTGIDNIDDIKANGTYTLTGHFTAKEEDSDELIEVEDATFDWFFGSYDDFMNPANGIMDTKTNELISIHDALTEYHNEHTLYLDDLKKLLGDDYVIDVTGKAQSYDLGKDYNGKLIIHAKEVKITTDVNFTNQLLVVTPNPLGEYTDPNQTTMYCINPREVALGGKTTVIPGDPELPEYPEDHTLGIRLGMEQITTMVNETKKLQIPLYMVKPNSTETQTNLGYKILDADNDIKVSSSTDPDWAEEEDAVAKITELVVTKKDNLEWDEDYFQLLFNNNALSFKEGYEYTLEVPYAEDVKITGMDKEGNPTTDTKTLTGTFHVTLKIVPEYVTWQGNSDGKHNWNNDDMDHWKRSTADELYDVNKDDRAEMYHKGEHYPNAYVPMRFTNVIIQNEKAYSAYPYLYELKAQNVILDMKAPANLNIGEATANIEYDLAVDEVYWKTLFGTDINNGSIYTCVRFYGNTCKDIYFKPQTALLHAEHLTYEKAWIDYELDANRWYTLASPLKGIVAGDMYLPSEQVSEKDYTAYAVQKLPAFKNITYGETKGTRWNPAVYMRGWDKSGNGTVVIPGGTGINYAIKGSWSTLYNKVSEPFTPATGFSIGVDADTEGKVMFRLPKADTKYLYFPNGNGDSGNEDELIEFVKGDERIDYGCLKLSEMKGENKSIQIETTDSGNDELKLVGNPFMAHLDMTKFFGENKFGSYYIMTKEGTTSNVLGKEYAITTGDDDPTKVAPLQSFLVKEGVLPQGGFTADMQTEANADGTPGLRSAIVAESKNKLPEIRITAEHDGKRNTAVVAYLSYASENYKADEDASLLIDKEAAAPQVYTLADKQMLAINLTDRLHDIPVGVYGTSDSPVTLTFSLSDKIANVTLYDKQEKKSYNVTEGMTLTVAGNTSGRYFLNGSTPTANDVIARNEIVCYSSGNGQIVVSSVDPLTRITVYDLSGKLVTRLANLQIPTAHVQGLNPGQIYIVRAETANQVQSEKVEVK